MATIKLGHLKYKTSLAALAVGLLFLQYYLSSSGSLQISQLFLLVFALLSCKSLFSNYSRIPSSIRIYFILFSAYALIVNSIQYFIHTEDSLLKSNLFILYNAIIFFSLATFYLGNSRQFLTLNTILWLTLISLLAAVVQYFIGLGRYDFAPRYNGFFNDPNQMAFWGLCSFGIVSLLAKDLKIVIVAFVAVFIVCMITMSRSSLLGIAPMMIGVFFKLGRSIYKSKFFIPAILMLSGIVMFFSSAEHDVKLSENSLYFIERIKTTDVENQKEVRGYNLLSEHPEQLIFGAGQGDMKRFNHDGEIHSTWHGILFYYGIPGLAFFLLFLYNMYRRLTFSEILISIGPLFYSFTTYGARTPLFYIFLACIFISTYQRGYYHRHIVQ